jgi:hypothetical protein
MSNSGREKEKERGRVENAGAKYDSQPSRFTRSRLFDRNASTKKLLADERATRFSTTKRRNIDPTIEASSYVLLDFANGHLAIFTADFEQCWRRGYFQDS